MFFINDNNNVQIKEYLRYYSLIQNESYIYIIVDFFFMTMDFSEQYTLKVKPEVCYVIRSPFQAKRINEELSLLL